MVHEGRDCRKNITNFKANQFQLVQIAAARSFYRRRRRPHLLLWRFVAELAGTNSKGVPGGGGRRAGVFALCVKEKRS